MTIIAGIDPGVTGAVALLGGRGWAKAVRDLPVVQLTTRKAVDGLGLYDLLDGLRPDAIGLEDNSIGPALGKAAVYSMGYSMGVINAVVSVLGIKLVRFSPRQWQAMVSLTSVQKQDRKKAHLQRARELFPECDELLARAKDHNRADALLIAEATRLQLAM